MNSEKAFHQSINGCSTNGKRKIDDITSDESEAHIKSHNSTKEKEHKQKIQDGFSWWTCMMYGMPYEKTKPQPVKVFFSQDLWLMFVNDCLSDMDTIDLPEKPGKPLDSDCCGNGCTPCVMDIYEQELKIWEQECLKLQKIGGQQDEDSETEEMSSQEDILSESYYRKLKIITVSQETHNTFRYRIKLPRTRSLGLKLGQHVIIRGHLNGVPVTRQYTPISDVTATGYFDLLIKIYPDGKMSQIVNLWKVHDSIDVRGPYGNLEYNRNKYEVVYMLAVGTGVAPMSQIIQGILGDEEEETRLRLIYGCATYKDILMKKELDAWSDFWNFSVMYALSQENYNTSSSYRYGDVVHHGRISELLLDNELDKKTTNIFVLICGTKEFETDMINHLAKIGLSDNQFYRF